MSEMTTSLPMEFQDQVVRVFAENGATGLVHMVLDFEDSLDADIVSVATRRMLEAEPILGCRFVETAKGAEWRRREDLGKNPEFRFHADIENVDAATLELVGRPFQVDETPNFMVELFRHGAGDRLIISISHVIADGGAILEATTRFATLYSALVADPDFRLPVNPASRDSFQWLKAFSVKNRLKIIWRDWGDIRRSLHRHLGLVRSHAEYQAAARNKPTYATLEVPSDRVREIDEISRARGLSRNDVLLAGFARAFATFVGSENTGSVHIVMPSNLRRFMGAEARPAICNLGGIANIFVEPDLGATFTETLDRIVREMARQRKAFIGAGNPITMRVLDRMGLARKRRVIARMMEKGMARPLPATFTNVGRLADRKMLFAEAAPNAAVLLANPLSAPLMLVVAMGYKGKLALSMSYYQEDFDGERVQRFLAEITANIVTT